MKWGDDERWESLTDEYANLKHVPKIQQMVAEKYAELTGKGVDYHDALEQALIDHAFKKDTRSIMMTDAASEYEAILEGDEIWADTQKTSGK